MKKCKMETHPSGLSTYDALSKLYNDIESVLKEYQRKNGKYKMWLYDGLWHLSPHTNFHWISATFLISTAVVLLILYQFDHSLSPNELLYSSLVILIFVIVNLCINLIENRLRHGEMCKRVVTLLATIKLAIQNVKWSPENYPHLCTPFSPCVTLQWVYRDGNLVNLPWALLVEGDVIVIRPGQVSPGHCESLEEDSEYPVLNPQEVYAPSLPYANEAFSVPRLKVPLKNKLFILKETPYLRNLRVALDSALNRPVTQFTAGKYFLFSQCLELFASPCIILLTIIFNSVKLIYLPLDFKTNWIDLFLIQPITAVLPLLPLTFPIFWIGSNNLGLAKLKTYFNNTSKASLNIESDHFTEPESLTEVEIDFKYRWSEVWGVFLDILTGKELMMTRSANILHVLAHLSALCVVDKKGILSWPNPTAEKIFFLRNSNNSQPSSVDSMNDSVGEETKFTCNRINHNKIHEESVTEVLDVTHNQNIPFKLEFDDHEWKQYLSSLKPLGLAILLNTCNIKTQENYNKFCSHITCEAMYNEHLVPVANRRCLCELSKQIGFENNAQSIFTLVEQLSTFRHLQSDAVCKDKLARALHLTTKLKFPFPHMVAVVVKETNNDTYQLFSQGTADIILDSCVDYWNGKDLVQLSLSDRKKITDFYSRTSLTSYCTAFAYRPLSRPVSSQLSQMYLELPFNNRQSFIGLRSPTPLHWDIGFGDSRDRVILNNFHSTDSLLFTEDKESVIGNVETYFEMQSNQIFLGMVTMQYQAQIDMVHLIERLERACIRFVHFSKENELRSRVFSEKMGLESGWNCHISLLSDKANSECWANNGTARIWSSTLFPAKTRKRCESEKINKEDVFCSMVNSTNLENSKIVSTSAPSAINVDNTLVKFDEENTNQHQQQQQQQQYSDDSAKVSKKDEENLVADAESEKDSVMVQSVDLSSHQNGWASLSCLTDSTEQSAPVNFDMSNRAKLPRGIENIRPHLESIDNVPLLVSLFTDCTPTTTAEMLHIMQDYGQSVCVIGSVANADNIQVFMQADASIAVEPLYPQLCQRVPVFTPINPVFGPSPVGLNRTLNSLPCSITFRREDPVSIFHLILEARQFMFSLWNCIQFWICGMLSISCLQLITFILLLPPIFSISQVLWLVCVIVPILSTSLIGNKKDPAIMQKPTQKLQYHFSADIISFVIWNYGCKFLTLVILILAIYGGFLVNFCENIIKQSQNMTCVLVYPTSADGIIFTKFEPHIRYSQEIAIFMTAFLLCIISIGFVHRDHLIWKRNPLKNILWAGVLFFLLFIQILYTFLNIIHINSFYKVDVSFAYLPWYMITLICFAPIFTFVITELIKWQEIQINISMNFIIIYCWIKSCSNFLGKIVLKGVILPIFYTKGIRQLRFKISLSNNYFFTN